MKTTSSKQLAIFIAFISAIFTGSAVIIRNVLNHYDTWLILLPAFILSFIISDPYKLCIGKLLFPETVGALLEHRSEN